MKLKQSQEEQYSLYIEIKGYNVYPIFAA
jgi:hypothetical protein